MEEKLREKFNNADAAIEIDEKKKSKTLLFLKKKIEEKQPSLICNKRRFLLNQLKYMDKTIFIYHLVICVIMLPVLEAMSRNGVAEKEIVITSVILSGIAGVISIAEIGRIFSSGIAEISETSYFNVRQIVAFNMFISGVINLTLLSVGIFFVSFRWKIEILRIGLYVLVPFVFVECGCLGALLMEVGRKNPYIQVIAGTFMIILFYIILISDSRVYSAAALAVWGVAFVFGLTLLAAQIGVLFNGIKKGEIICMN